MTRRKANKSLPLLPRNDYTLIANTSNPSLGHSKQYKTNSTKTIKAHTAASVMGWVRDLAAAGTNHTVVEQRACLFACWSGSRCLSTRLGDVCIYSGRGAKEQLGAMLCDCVKWLVVGCPCDQGVMNKRVNNNTHQSPSGVFHINRKKSDTDFGPLSVVGRIGRRCRLNGASCDYVYSDCFSLWGNVFFGMV